MKRLLSVILILVLTATVCAPVVSARDSRLDDYYYGKGNPYYLHYPTKNQIIAKARELGIDLSHTDNYAEAYSLEPYHYQPGRLDDESYRQALNMLNFYRYIAGLPSDIQIKEEYNEIAQAGALVNAINDTLTHYPVQPEGMSNDLFALSEVGNTKCNIAWNYKSLALAMQNGWMDDSNAGNISHAGHRRWMMNPGMQYAGFGEVGKYTNFYTQDRSRQGRFAGNYVAWPAPNTPLDLFLGSLCTITLGAQYDEPDPGRVTVEISSEALGKSWTVNQYSSNAAFYVDTSGFGIDRCIIFKVADFTQEDTLHIRVTGITKYGVEAPIEYTAHLFSMSQITVDSTTIMTKPSWAADYNVSASSLLSSEEPQIRWRSANPNVCEVWTYNGRPVYYGKSEGRTTITVYTGGAYKDVDVIIKNSKFLLGDADDDGEVMITDVTLMQRDLIMMEIPHFCDYLCDIDRNGEFDVPDVTLLQRWFADIPVDSPVGTCIQSPFTL